VEVTDSALAAIARAGAEKFDLIFMDCQMPGMDGYEATRRLRAQLGDQCPPVVAMTAHVEPAQREEAFASGMRDYLAKPVSIDALAVVLGRWLGEAPSATPPPVQFRTRAGEAIIASTKLAELREAFDVEGLSVLYAAFGESMESLIGRVEENLLVQNAAELETIFHAIKGISANVGAMRIAGIVSRMSNAASQHNFAALGQAPALLRAALEEVRVETERSREQRENTQYLITMLEGLIAKATTPEEKKAYEADLVDLMRQAVAQAKLKALVSSSTSDTSMSSPSSQSAPSTNSDT
jgi:CheY-like chemotaxis protein